MTDNSQKIFLISGVSSGLGRAFAEGAIKAGHRVIGTVRRQEDANCIRFTRTGPLKPAAAGRD